MPLRLAGRDPDAADMDQGTPPEVSYKFTDKATVSGVDSGAFGKDLKYGNVIPTSAIPTDFTARVPGHY
jgi:hypothetical protein